MFLVCSSLIFLTDNKIQVKLGFGILRLSIDGPKIAGAVYSNLASVVDQSPEFVLSFYNDFLTSAKEYKKLSFSQLYQDFSGAIMRANDQIPKKAGQAGIAILRYKEDAKKAPGMVWLALKNNVQKSSQNFVIAINQISNEFKTQKYIKVFNEPQNIVVGIKEKIFARL